MKLLDPPKRITIAKQTSEAKSLSLTTWIKSVNPTKNRGKITMPNQTLWIKSLNPTFVTLNPGFLHQHFNTQGATTKTNSL